MAVIKQAWKVFTKPYDVMLEYANHFNDRAYSLFVQEFAEIDAEFEADLREYPPVPPGSTYQRTYKLRDGWQISIGQVGGDQFKLEVSNTTGYAVWVVGSLAQIRSAAARFQREFHKAHGWELATDTVTYWWARLLDGLQARIDTDLSQFGTVTTGRRARTRIG